MSNTGFTSLDDPGLRDLSAYAARATIAALPLVQPPPALGNLGTLSLDDPADSEVDVTYIVLPDAKPGTRDYRIEEDGAGHVRLRIAPLARAMPIVPAAPDWTPL